MDQKRLKAYLRESLKEAPTPRKMEETIEFCRARAKDYPVEAGEERTGFWEYLSDIFRYEGLFVWGLQVLALMVACLGLLNPGEGYLAISFFGPLFSFAVMPVLLKGQMHGMSEMEAATRASGPQLILARLLLAGAADLICLTVFLCMAVRHKNACGEIGQLILYVLVPYLSSMVVVLQRIRLCRREGFWECVAAGAGSCIFWGLSARLFPWLYEVSAGGVWVTLFLVFGGFFVKEIWFIREMRKEGKMYGTID